MHKLRFSLPVIPFLLIVLGVAPPLDAGAISGAVTAAAAGEALPAVDVDVWDSGGSRVASGMTDDSGFYTVGGLAAGTYFATTRNLSGFLDELYDDLPCPGGGSGDCDPTSGTPIEVNADVTTAGIDFALRRLGAVSGRVTSSATGEAISFLDAQVWAADGSLAGTGLTDSGGSYTVGGLAAGTYFVTTRNLFGFLDELYDDFPCPGGAPAGCDPAAGSPVAVTVGSTASGIDFALERLGSISGTVTSAATGEPIPANIEVAVWNVAGALAGSGFTDAAGAYTVGGLAAGTYFATTRNFADLLDELYDNLPCPGGAGVGCDPSTGTPIEVSINATTEGIDFALGLAQAQTCWPSAASLCLRQRRFRVEASWRAPGGVVEAAQAVPLSGQSGYFWFFDLDNVEVTVKVLDACGAAAFDSFWVFASGMTNVEVTLTVTDTETGQTEEYRNPQGRPFQPILDTGAFRTCP